MKIQIWLELYSEEMETLHVKEFFKQSLQYWDGELSMF